MDEEEREVNRRTWWIMGIILLVLICSVAIYYIWFQKKQMQEMTEMFALEKEIWTDEAEEISLQYEGMKFSVNNDSIFALLITEQEKVQRLQEELRTVKLTNTRRINELRKEVETIRKIAQSYIVQIDSLNKENENLKEENTQITRRNQALSNQVVQFSRQVDQLGERVQRASQLNAVNIQLKPINARGRDVKIDNRAATQLMLTFIISRNITAPVGEQTIYVRLMKPDDSILTKPNYGFFRYENKDIEWSMSKRIEYDGEDQSITMYWPIEEYLSQGTYRVEIFVGGNRIGNRSFTM